MNARFIGIGVSIVLSIASIILFFKPGLNYGIDFKGGIQAEISTSQPADLARLRAKLGALTWVKSHFKPLAAPIRF
ncbi:SecD/SecF family protein-export membrane protein [Brucella neotomae]|nr:SecD/SecF family protein-export membrane protein [Brucella neotomae]